MPFYLCKYFGLIHLIFLLWAFIFYLKNRFIFKLSLVVLLTSVILTFSYCGSLSGKAVDEGVIEYETKVINESHPLAGLAPTSATLKFKGDKFMMEMSALGMFNTIFICDLPKKTLTQMVKFMDMKNACIETEKDIIQENNSYQIVFVETNEKKVIAGYNCKKAKASMANDPSITFDVYYTNEMGVEHVNALSPYAPIKGMLMQYRLKKMGLEMEFTAKTVKKAEVPDVTFELPAYYKIISIDEMQQFFAGLQ